MMLLQSNTPAEGKQIELEYDAFTEEYSHRRKSNWVWVWCFYRVIQSKKEIKLSLSMMLLHRNTVKEGKQIELGYDASTE